jgi:hypothetical protein
MGEELGMTSAEYRKLIASRKKQKKHKFGAKSVTSLCHYGFSHRSKLERAVCDMIWLREKAGELRHVGHERRLTLYSQTEGKVTYVADFEVFPLPYPQRVPVEGGIPPTIFIEAKGVATAPWRRIVKAWKQVGVSPLEVYGGNYRRPKLLYTLDPAPALPICSECGRPMEAKK